MSFLTGSDRYQSSIVALDDMVAPDSEARVIDAFVDSLDLAEMGLSGTGASCLGRPAYDPAALLKLYIYGYRNGIRSSRKLARACEVNVEVMWLMGSLTPDFRTVADFRKGNARCLKAVFAEFTRRVMAGFEPGFQSVDGTKVRASNAKDANFTISKLDDRIARLEGRTAEYLRLLDEADADDGIVEGRLPRAELERRLAEATERLARYEGYRNKMEAEGLSQLSLTDPDSKLMKTRNGFDVAYNAQAAVDSETHMITALNVTNSPTDHGQLLPTLQGLRRDGAVLEATADKGYVDSRDMAACLESGIVPNVILPDGKDTCEVELDYAPDEEADPASTDAAGLARCLRAGVVPDAYRDAIDSIEVRDAVVFVDDEGEQAAAAARYGTQEEMRERAAQGFFVRDPERNLVVCPAGELLRKKSIKKNGDVRYANKLACKRCEHRGRCITGSGKWKEVDFSKDCLEKRCAPWSKAAEAEKPRRSGKKREKVKRVFVQLRPKRALTSQRMCLSEHPFGTIKRAMGSDHFLLRGMEKVTGEFSLMALGYNLARARSLLGFDALIEAVRG